VPYILNETKANVKLFFWEILKNKKKFKKYENMFLILLNKTLTSEQMFCIIVVRN